MICGRIAQRELGRPRENEDGSRFMQDHARGPPAGPRPVVLRAIFGSFTKALNGSSQPAHHPSPRGAAIFGPVYIVETPPTPPR